MPNPLSGPATQGLDRLFMLSPGLLCIAGTDGYFKRVNPAFPKTLGHTEAHLKSRPFIEFVHPDDRQPTLDELGKLSQGIPAVHFENRYRHANGSYRWLLWNTTPVVEEELLYASAFDVTERKHAAAMLQNLLFAAPDAMIITDHCGNINRINRATEILFGYRSSELIGQSVDVLFSSRFRDEHREHLNLYAEDPRPRLIGGGLEMFGVRKAGVEFPVEVSLGPTGIEETRSVIYAVRDVSTRRQRERELQEREVQHVQNERKLQALASRLVLAEESERRRVARGLHDDVGQTLAAAKIQLGELLEAGPPGKKNPAARQLQDLLDHAIETTRSLTFELASAVLYEVGLGAALQSLAEQTEQNSSIQFHTELNLKAHPISEETKVVLYRSGRELIRNVLRHSKARTVRLSLCASASRIHLTVEDDGRGYEASKGLPDEPMKAGFGLLSIAQQLEHIGGQFEITSSPGSGTRAVVSAPLDARRDGT